MANEHSWSTRLARFIYRGAAIVLRRLGPLFPIRGTQPARVRRVLIVRIWALGEFVTATPMMRALREGYPDARIELLVGNGLAPLAAGLPWLDECIVVDEAPLLRASPLAWGRLIWQLRRRRYDIAVCLHHSVLIAGFLWLCGVRWRVGFDRDGEGFFHHVRVRCNVPGRHAVDEYLEPVRRLGIEPSTPIPELRWVAAADARADEALASLAGARGIVGILPTGADNVAANRLGTNIFLKRWPPEYYIDLARRLLARGDVGVAVLGGKVEKALGARIAREVPGVLDLTARIDLPTLAAVCSRLAVVVTNDSGPLHVASASGTRVLAIFGPTDPLLAGPYTPAARVFVHPVECGPCFRRDTIPPSYPDCPHQRCMRAVEPALVADAVIAWMGEDRALEPPREAFHGPLQAPPYERREV